MPDQWVDRLSEYLDGELNADETARLERHLGGCDECRAVMGEIRAVVATAAELTDEDPQSDLWQGIADRIETARVVELAPARGRVVQFSVPQLAAAAVFLILISGGIVSKYSADPASPFEAVAAGSAVPEGLFLAGNVESGYQFAIADMEEALEQGRDRLDPETVRVLEESLKLVDGAIREARRALAVDPGSAYLSRYLARTMRRKLDVLEHGNNLIAAASL